MLEETAKRMDTPARAANADRIIANVHEFYHPSPAQVEMAELPPLPCAPSIVPARIAGIPTPSGVN
jgi:hypothetical protein